MGSLNRGLLIVLVGSLLELGCSGDSVLVRLEVAAEPPSAAADGSPVQLTIRAYDAVGELTDCDVLVTVSHGTLDGGGYTGSAKLVQGRGTLTYRCSAVDDALCTGRQVVRVSNGLATGYATVDFTR